MKSEHDIYQTNDQLNSQTSKHLLFCFDCKRSHKSSCIQPILTMDERIKIIDRKVAPFPGKSLIENIGRVQKGKPIQTSQLN